MAEQWISAAKAHLICRDRYVLCERAHAGLLIGRADLFISKGARSQNTVVPDWFWWARGHEALEQNWTTGDFSTWTDGKHHHQAFSVRFELEGVMACVPEDQRAEARRSCSIAGSKDWLALSAASARLRTRRGLTEAAAQASIVAAGEAGFLDARAVIAEGCEADANETGRRWALREWSIPDWFWRGVATEGLDRIDWSAGVLHRPVSGPDGEMINRLSGVYVAMESVIALEGGDAPPPASVGKAQGRPSIPFAEDMLCEVWAQIYEGRITDPKKADLVRLMQDWAARKGHELPDSTAKRRADLVLQYMNRSDQN